MGKLLSLRDRLEALHRGILGQQRLQRDVDAQQVVERVFVLVAREPAAAHPAEGGNVRLIRSEQSRAQLRQEGEPLGGRGRRFFLRRHLAVLHAIEDVAPELERGPIAEVERLRREIEAPFLFVRVVAVETVLIEERRERLGRRRGGHCGGQQPHAGDQPARHGEKEKGREGHERTKQRGSAGLPDADVVEAHPGAVDREMEAALGRMRKAGGLQKRRRLPVDTHPHPVADEFNHGLMPAPLLEPDRAGRTPAHEQGPGLRLPGGILAQREDVVAHHALLVVADPDLPGCERHPADVAGVRSLEGLIVEDGVERGGAFEPELERHDHIAHRPVHPAHRTVIRAGLHRVQRAVSHCERRNHGFPLAEPRPLEVVREEELASPGEGRGRHGGGPPRDEQGGGATDMGGVFLEGGRWVGA